MSVGSEGVYHVKIFYGQKKDDGIKVKHWLC